MRTKLLRRRLPSVPKGIIREGIVATRCGSHNALTGQLQGMMRSGHVALTDIRKFKYAEANYWADRGGSETVGTTVATVTAAVEYPVGVFSQITFGGQITGIVPVGGTLESDYVTPDQMIPNGATFWLRRYINNSGGFFFFNNARNAGIGDLVAFANTGLVDMTMGGTIVNGGTLWIPPAAIIAPTSGPTVLITGDSISAGLNDDTTIADFREGIIAKGFPATLAFLNHGCSGADTGTYLALALRRRVLWKYVTHVVSGLVNNDIFINSNAAATVVANLQNKIWSQFPPGTPILQITCTPRSTSTDSWKTALNQTTHANNGIKNTFNGLIRAGGIAGMTGFFETAWAGEDAHDNGKWISDGVTNFLTTSDGVHGSPTGYTSMAAAVFDATKYLR